MYLLYIVTFLTIFFMIHTLIWIFISHSNYTRQIRPGQYYKIGDRVYRVPELQLQGPAKLLHESFILEQRFLLKTIIGMFENLNIEHWLSGGTLLGFVRHGTTIPWDDDCDIHTHWCNRNFMFSRQFSNHVDSYGLETLFLKGSSHFQTNKHSGVVRIRKKGNLTPVCDVFFVHQLKNDSNFLAKIDSWRGDTLYYNHVETWCKNDILPIQKRYIDDMYVYIPNRPHYVLQQQYGTSFSSHMVARDVLFSHLYPFKMFPYIWKRYM